MVRETSGQSQVEIYQRLKNSTPCLTLSIIRYGSRAKWSKPGNEVALAPTLTCWSYWKGSLRITFDYGRPRLRSLTFIHFKNWLDLVIILLAKGFFKKLLIIACFQVGFKELFQTLFVVILKANYNRNTCWQCSFYLPGCSSNIICLIQHSETQSMSNNFARRVAQLRWKLECRVLWTPVYIYIYIYIYKYPMIIRVRSSLVAGWDLKTKKPFPLNNKKTSTWCPFLSASTASPIRW